MRFNSGFIGRGNLGTSANFLDGDSEVNFIANLRTQPNDWYYRRATVSYKINNLGHRSKNIEEIDLDNYILFSGCSHTEGLGLELENTYPFITAQNLNCDYYNLGLSGTGIDILAHNLLLWSHKVKKSPKAVVSHVARTY